MVEGRPVPSYAGRPLLELVGIGKSFGRTAANRDVHLDVWPGEILGILGENGAGKSTLMNIIAGLLSPNVGKILVNGETVRFSSPRDAAAAGIGMVHQHFKLIGSLTVAENIALGDARWGRGMLRLTSLRKEVGALAATLGVAVDFDRRVDDLTVGEQQRVEILKALSRRPQLLILDEPTAVLTQDERLGLFRLIADLAERRMAVIIISHKLEDILENCRRVVVMRQGSVVDRAHLAGCNRADLVRMVVGEDLPAVVGSPERAVAAAPLITVENLTVRRANGTLAVDGASFALLSNEVLGVCGVDGNGQSELIQALTGMVQPASGRVHYHLQGVRDGWQDAAMLRRLGLCHIPEDRHRHAILADLPLTANYLMTHLGRREFNWRGWLRRRAVHDRVAAAISAFEVRAPGPHARMAELSGGNQQKFVLAREFACAPRIIVAAHPTRGLNVRTIAFVRRQLMRMRAEGAEILLLSADLQEIWEMADRVAVMAAGRIRGPVAVSETTLRNVGHWMTAR